ncbi:MAG: protein kinase domain-containing protein [Armatimonadota bacterium]
MTIGRYQITREIARSNDIVYEAFDPQLGRKLALKELALDIRVQEPERRLRIDRFFREARAAGNLSHPGIVTIFDFGEDNGRYFIAMEYLEGETLKSRIARTGALPTEEAIRILSALCDAVEYAHARQIVHRDIKPDNIHILPDGSVKITDFGIARMLGEQTITVAGQVFGTPSYMAPEQVRGAMVDARTDIFSLGLVLFEMLSGRKAFWGEALETVVYRIMSEPVPPLHDQPANINAVIQMAVQKDPGQRYVSAAQMKAALTGGVAGSSTSFTRQPQTGWQAADRTVMASPSMANQTSQLAVDRTRMAPQTSFTPPNNQPMPVQAPMQMQPSASWMSGNRVFVAVIGMVVVLIGLGIGAIALRSATSRAGAGIAADSSDDTYNQASTRYNVKDYAGALPLFQQVRLAPGTRAETKRKAEDGVVFCYIGLAEIAKEKQDFAAAMKWYDEGIVLRPADANLLKLRSQVAEIVASQGGPTPAPAPENDRTQHFPAPQRSDVPTSTGQQFEQQNEKNAQDAMALLQQGDTAFNQGNTDQALTLWQQASEKGIGTQVFDMAQQRILNGHP